MTDRIAIHTEAARPTSGGGLTYAVAIAAALAEAVEVDLHLPFVATPEELTMWLPPWPLPVSVVPPTAQRRHPVEEGRQAVRDRRWSVVVRETSHIPPLTAATNSVLVTSFPFDEAVRRRDRLRIASYRTVIVNSSFTARSVANRWHRDSLVLHPPVEPVAPRPKRPWILAVGRFTGGGRSKRQLEMVDVFRSLGEEVHRRWELHLAGFVEDAAYLAEVRARATDLPVRFHPHATRPELERLYGESSLFWHACGLGIDEQREPHRVEHFGIATAEAMSAGCVPVVLAAGGQPEIVGTDGKAGALWHTTEQWVRHTHALLEDGDQRRRSAAIAQNRAAALSFAVFAPRARALVLGSSSARSDARPAGTVGPVGDGEP